MIASTLTDEFIQWIESLPPGSHPIKPTSIPLVKDYIATSTWGGFITLSEKCDRIYKADRNIILGKSGAVLKNQIKEP